MAMIPMEYGGVVDVSSEITNKITGLTLRGAYKSDNVVTIDFVIPANTANGATIFKVSSKLTPVADTDMSGARTNANAGSTMCRISSSTGACTYYCITTLSETVNFHMCFLTNNGII